MPHTTYFTKSYDEISKTLNANYEKAYLDEEVYYKTGKLKDDKIYKLINKVLLDVGNSEHHYKNFTPNYNTVLLNNELSFMMGLVSYWSIPKLAVANSYYIPFNTDNFSSYYPCTSTETFTPVKNKSVDESKGITSKSDLVYYVTCKKVSDYNFKNFYLLDRMLKSTGESMNYYQDKYKDLYTVSSIVTYYNFNDGDYSETNQRVLTTSTYNPFFYTITEVKFSDGTLHPIYGSFSPYSLFKATNAINSSDGNQKAQFNPVNALLNEGFVSEDEIVAFHETGLNKEGPQVYIAMTKDKIAEIFQSLGLNVCFTSEEAIFKPTSEFEYPTFPNGGNNAGAGGNNAGAGGQGGGETAGGEGESDETSDPILDGTTATGTSELSKSWAIDFENLEQLQTALLDNSLWLNVSSFFKDVQSGVINVMRFPFDLLNQDNVHCVPTTPINILGVPIQTPLYRVAGYEMKPQMRTRINMGSYEFKEFFGSFLDYDPYTKITIYLPYLGYKKISANSVMNRKLDVFYNVSYLDGSCIAVLMVDEVPIYTYEGQLGYQVPLSKTDASSITQSAIKTGIGALSVAGLAVASGGALGSLAGATIPSTTSTSATIAMGTIAGNSAINTVASLTQKTTATTGGTGTGVHARAMSPIPFLIIERPITNMPPSYGAIAGYQTNLYKQLSECKGFTSCDNVRLNGFSFATESEKDEIKQLLSKGVII